MYSSITAIYLWVQKFAHEIKKTAALALALLTELGHDLAIRRGTYHTIRTALNIGGGDSTKR